MCEKVEMVRDNHCSHRARERAIEERMLHDREEEEDESSHHAAQPGAPPNCGPVTRLGSSGVTEGPPSVS